MCGIAGFSLSDSTNNIDATALATALLHGIEERGRDAAGVAWHDTADGQVWIHKNDVKASLFTPSIDIGAARTAICHTRAATKGSPTQNVNNHPIEHHGIVGVHNGMIWNDDSIFDDLQCERTAKVDSEAAFALIARGPELYDAPLDELLPLLKGSATLAWMDVDEPDVLHLARVSQNPLIVAQSQTGSLLFASTRKTVLEAAMQTGFRIKYINDLPEGSHLRVKAGRITDVQRFTVARRGVTPSQYRNVRTDSATYGWLSQQRGSS
jgi:glucosamine 6-phosphate synthetase-like amidotransferase/phosphosugar isomerase protein